MNKKFICFNFSNYGQQILIEINKEYSIYEQNLIINNILDYIEKINLEKFKLLLILTVDFIIINILLILQTESWGYISLPCIIDDFGEFLFGKKIWIFNIKKWINDNTIKEINYTGSKIIYSSSKKNEFITVEENGIIHVSFFIEENKYNIESHFSNKNYYIPLYINSIIDFIEEISYCNIYKKVEYGIIIIYKNNIISFISKKKILFGMAIFNLKNIKQQYLKININLDNTFCVNYRGLINRKIKTFDYYFLESLLRCVIEKKTINIFILKTIMIHLYNDNYSLILLNILIKNYLDNSYKLK